MDDIFPAFDPSKNLKNYGKVDKKEEPIGKCNTITLPGKTPPPVAVKRGPLTTKDAVKYLLEGTLKSKVCRYCLNIAPELSELDKILQVADKETLYKVTIKDMIASFHPFKVAEDANFPDKICEKCLNRTLSAYLFTQQCEQAERALRNCFEDMYEKLDKLDPLERTKKRGRQKLNPNHNVLHTEHEKVIHYADPIIHIVNTASEQLTEQNAINELECLKCCEILPNVESLLNHTKTHPKTMWYNCRLCGTSFPKQHHLKKHFRSNHSPKSIRENVEKPCATMFDCKICGVVIENYYSYLQHAEKHKFKVVMEHLVERKMDKLCSICFNKEHDMVQLDKMICLHGGCPELTGDRSLYTVLASTLPEMNILDNYTGTKICQKCLSHAVTSYVFTNQSYFVRNRLDTCVSIMLENLDKIKETENNICIEIAQSAIMTVGEPFDDTVPLEEDLDETKLGIQVLEDEFRLKSEDESESENKTLQVKREPLDITNILEADAQIAFLNGYEFKNEYLSFKKKRKPSAPKFNCPICNKHFISDYFLKRHILKHIPNKVNCDSCNIQFRSKFDLYEHKKITHLMNRKMYLTCEICGRGYLNEEKLRYHVVHHKNQPCQLCDKRFKSFSHYNDHMQRHMHKLGAIMKKYTQNCSFCEKDCSNDNEFSLHVNKIHLQIKPYSCDMCERHFYTEYNLRSHKKVHSVFSREQCNFCNKILNSRLKLVIHIRKHIGDMPFWCQICNTSFYSQLKLKKHLIVYHGGSFCCKLCKTAFVTKRELKEHVITHNSLF